MPLSRRKFLASSSAAVMASGLPALATAAPPAPALIIDTHQHLWDLKRLPPPWVAKAPEVLRKTYFTDAYREAVAGLKVQTVYMEVDVAEDQQVAESELVLNLIASGEHGMLAAVIGGRPASPEFDKYLARFKAVPAIKGVRQVLHGDAPAGFCLGDDFVRGVRLLGERGLSCDLCMRPTELADGVKLTERCPDTRFVLDHCGNADPKAFRATASAEKEKPWHAVEPWKRDIEAFAKRPNVICKISGIVARAPQGWQADDLAPIVEFCLDTFGPDRVVFGGDWPVCLLGGTLRQWIDALGQITANRPAEVQRKLWSENAVKWYGLKA